MTSYPGPVVQRALLIIKLRRLRLRAGSSDADVAEGLEWPLSRLARLENGASHNLIEELESLLDFLGVDAGRREELLAIARRSLERGWWEPFLPVLEDPAFLRYLTYEGGASSISAVESVLVPGLLQTEAYARTVLREYRPDLGTDRLEELVRLRMERQRLMNDPTTRPGRATGAAETTEAAEAAEAAEATEATEGDEITRIPPTQLYLIDEAVLRRRVGAPQVMVDQLERLLDACDRPSVTVRVLPWDALHAAFKGPYWLLEFDEDIDDVLYLEGSPRSSTFIGRSPEINDYRVNLVEARENALDASRSRDLLREARRFWLESTG